ncbi:thiamine pyrophosphate-dependent dehydrogenase E1 component subunit alpha [Micrococcus cohnii]|uniref:2-oxoisovalerate dehydrogenase subunit alpha n=1 Tax=Micrococcus cohnii TaxID=993416 RepID=A0A7W7GPA3_9MICC|nr:thiamine pyrophosphate-dependent enzyme [Micrococcus cohnii]MBB4735794.1 pyruvate dehydrogenase E1 component alpha subunit [Micrococcus cohnii]
MRENAADGAVADDQVGPAAEPHTSFGITLEEYLLPATRRIQLVSEDGRELSPEEQDVESGHEYPMPSDDELLAAYRHLVVGRRVNDQAYALVRQGRMAVYPSSHGQEASEVAAAVCLGKDDWLFPTYRDTVAVMSRGVPATEVMVAFQGSWHQGYNPSDYNTSVQSTPLTTQMLHAVGLAQAKRLKGEDAVVLAMVGDGGSSEGDFHEALNFAAVFKLPVIFFVQNNKYAISVPLARQSAAPTLAHKAVGYGLAGERVDGNDLAALLAVLGRAVDLCRAGGGPFLVEADTYRMQAHTNTDDPTRYRDDAEVTEWEARDPLRRMTAFLTERGVLTEEVSAEIQQEAESVAGELREAMNAEPEVDPLELFDHVYTVQTPQLAEQREQLAEELSRTENKEA